MEDQGDRVATAVAQEFARLRREKGWTLEELGARAGLHRTSLGLLERGERRLSLVSASRLAAAFDRPLWSIIRDVEERLP